MAIFNHAIRSIHLSQMICRILGAILVAFCLFGAINKLNAKEWEAKKEQKSGGFIGVSYKPWLNIGVFGGYQWYLYDKPHFNLGVRLVGALEYEFYYLWHNFTFDITPHFIWDFFNSDKHTLGWHFAPFGFGLGMTAYNDVIRNTSNDFLTSYAYGSRISGSNISLDIGYLFQTGLHYYYDINHQVYITYRAGNMYRHNFKIGYAYKF